MKFRSKIDAWLAMILIFSAAVALFTAFVIALRIPHLGLLTATVIALLGAGLPLWFLFSTNYLVKDKSLIVRSGPFSWHIPLSSVTHIVPTQSMLSSPALSLDRLRIEYDHGKVVLLSPRDKEAFLQAINVAKNSP